MLKTLKVNEFSTAGGLAASITIVKVPCPSRTVSGTIRLKGADSSMSCMFTSAVLGEPSTALLGPDSRTLNLSKDSSTVVSSSTVMIGLMLLFRNEPSHLGLLPYGALADAPSRRKVDPAEEKQRARAFLISMQGTNAFKQLVAVHFLGCVGHAIVIIYIIPIAVVAGINVVSAAGILSTLMAVSVLTRFLTPVVADYLGAKRAMATMFVLQGLPVLMLFWTQELWQFYLFAVVFGVGYGGEGSAFPIINRQYFGRGPMGRSFGWQQFGAGTGMAVGGWIGGVLFFVFGSYDITVIVSVLASVGGAALILSMPPTAKLLIPDWEDAFTSDIPPERSRPIAAGD